MSRGRWAVIVGRWAEVARFLSARHRPGTLSAWIRPVLARFGRLSSRFGRFLVPFQGLGGPPK